MNTSPLCLRIAPNSRFAFTWNGYPLTMFTLPEALRVKHSHPHMTIIDQRIRVVDDSEANMPTDDNEDSQES